MDLVFACTQWLTLIVIGGSLALRLFTGSRNGVIIAALALLGAAVILAVPAVYGVVDPLLGAFNASNLVLRFLIFAAFYLIGRQMAEANGGPLARAAISAKLGVAVLALMVALLIVLFVLIASQNAESSAGLLLQKQAGLDPALAYGVVGYAYPAFVAALLIGPVHRDAMTLGAPGRAVSILLLVAFVEIVTLPILQGVKIELSAFSLGKLVVQYSALMLIGVALAILRLQSIRRRSNEREAAATQ